MAKTKRRTMITAGRLVYGVCYTAALPRDEGQQRAAKLKASSAARQRINLKHSWQKLEVVIAANFSYRDLVLTLTYDEGHLPSSTREAVRLLKKFLTQLRAERQKYGGELKYIYVTESRHDDGRIHHHVIINGTGSDYELIRSLWVHGSAINIDTVDTSGYEELARYLTKEARENGSPNGARTWIPSKGLIHPKAESDWVDDNLTLAAPPGAIILEAEAPTMNAFGSYTYIKYLLPEPKRRKSRPVYQRKKNKDAFLSDLEHTISSEKG